MSNASPSSTRKRFKDKVTEFGGPSAAALALKVSRATIDFIERGKRSPGMEVAFRIEKLFGIRMQDWMSPVEIEQVRRIA